MNKKGQAIFYSLMVGLVIIILGLALAPAVSQSTNTARNTSSNVSYTDADGNTGNITQIGMDCSNSSISNFDKAACLATDLTLPYFIGFLIFLAGAIITAIITFGGQQQ